MRPTSIGSEVQGGRRWKESTVVNADQWKPGSRKRLQTGRVPTCVCHPLCRLCPEPWDLGAITTLIAEVRK